MKKFARAWSMFVGAVMILASSLHYQDHTGFYIGWALFHVALGEALHQWDQ